MSIKNACLNCELIEKRVPLYHQIFLNISNKIEKDTKVLEEKEEKIWQLRKNLTKKFHELHIKNYNIEIFDEFKKKILEFKIDLQISALNAKIKSLDLEEFSNIISVIGLSLQDESFKVLRKFEELKAIFDEIIKNFENIHDEIHMINHVNIQFSKSGKRLNEFIKSKILPVFKDDPAPEEIVKLIQEFNEKLQERLVYIYYLQNSNFRLNIRKFLHNLMICFRKIKFSLKDFLNFVFKISYLTLVAKIEVGRLKDDRFIVVVLTLEEVTEEAVKINKEILKIYKYYKEIFSKFTKIYSDYSVKMKNLIFIEYNEIIRNIKNESEARLKFFTQELENIREE